MEYDVNRTIKYFYQESQIATYELHLYYNFTKHYKLKWTIQQH